MSAILKRCRFFETEEEKALAVEYVKSHDVTVRTELVAREPIMEWDEIITLDSIGTRDTIKRSESVLAKIIPFVKESVG